MGRICILTHILIHLAGLYLASAQQAFWFISCTNDTNTQGSGNLEQVLTYLSSKNATSTYGFANSSAGESPDVVNGIALCRADVEPDTCVTCLNNARRRLMVDCPNKKEAIGWYDNCMLRYSNRSIFNTVETIPEGAVENITDAPDKGQFNQVLRPLLVKLQSKAAEGVLGLGKFATGKENITNSDNLTTIYGLVQCTPDLSESGCRNCLDSAILNIQTCCDGKVGARIYRASCFIRYETYLFYNETRVDPPSVAPPPAAIAPPPAADVPPTVELPTGGNNRKIVVASTTLAAAVAVVILVLGVYRWHRIKREQTEERILLHGSEAPTSIEGSSRFQSDEDESGEMHFFNLKTIQEATNNFSIEYKLGEGGFGPVYKGMLNDGRVVAVKRLSKNSGQGLQEFKTEVRLIVKLQHKNLVRLLGCCTEKGEKLLIYEFMPNNSLDTFLFDQEKCRELDWPMRANIVGGIAKGLRYLHEDSRLRIIHRDMKASNVLLDDDMNAKISDFGTARIFGGNQIEANTNRIVGTYGYMAPEYAMEGVFSTKSDVYSFGVLLLEIISGKRNSGFYLPEHLKNLLSYAWRMWNEGTAEQLIDENILESCLVSEALRWTNIALLCVQEDPNDRPTMSSVVFMLEGQWTSLPQPSEPPFSAVRFIMSDQSSSTGACSSIQSSTSASNTS